MNVTLFLEIKNEYTEHLVDTLTPFIYEGLCSFYKEAVNISEDTKNKDKVLLIFQKLLQSIDGWTQIKIEEETNRIKQMSGTSEYLDDLVKSVIKSNIILLTYSNNVSSVIAQTFYNTLSTSTLIHRCYIECAKDAHNNPFLFYHDVEPMDLKRNQIMIEKNIQGGIIRGIRKILPISLILKEYLSNSVNIIYEPPHVELVGDKQPPTIVPIPGANNLIPGAPQPEQGLPVDNDDKNNDKDNKVNDKTNDKANDKINPSQIKSDKQLEKQVMKMVATENNKSDKDKVKALMQLEKALNSAEAPKEYMQPKLAGGKAHNINRLLDDDKRHHDYTPNKHLNRSEKAIININFNSESEKHNKSTSKGVTTISDRPGINRIRPNLDLKADLKNVGYIEEYGAQSESVAYQKDPLHRKKHY